MYPWAHAYLCMVRRVHGACRTYFFLVAVAVAVAVSGWRLAVGFAVAGV